MALQDTTLPSSLVFQPKSQVASTCIPEGNGDTTTMRRGILPQRLSPCVGLGPIKRRRCMALKGGRQPWTGPCRHGCIPQICHPFPCVTLGRLFDPPSPDSGAIKTQSILEGLCEDKRACVCAKFRLQTRVYSCLGRRSVQFILLREAELNYLD